MPRREPEGFKTPIACTVLDQTGEAVRISMLAAASLGLRPRALRAGSFGSNGFEPLDGLRRRTLQTKPWLTATVLAICRSFLLGSSLSITTERVVFH